MRVNAREFDRARRSGRATAVSVRPAGTAVEGYQVSLGQRQSLKDAGVIGLPSWSDPATLAETWVRVPRLSATCPRRVIAFVGGRGDINRCMVFGDEFGGAAVDSARWATSGVVTVANSEMVASSSTHTVYSYILSQARISSVGTAVRSRLKASRFASTNSLITFGAVYPLSTSASGQALAFLADDGGLAGKYRNYDGSAVSASQAITGMSSATYAIQDIARTATAVKYTVDGANAVTIATNVPTADLQIVARTAYPNASGVNNPLTVNWVVVRKYVPAEPLAGTAQPSTTNRAISRPMSHADLVRAAVAG